MTQVPLIYSTSPIPQRVGWLGRMIALGVSSACLGILMVAMLVRPSASGVGSHRQLGLSACQFLMNSRLPCPSCGLTTSFAYFVRGNVVASLYVQPFGTLLAALSGMCFWGGLIIGISGKPLHRLLRLWPGHYYVLTLAALAILAWIWKIFIQLRGVDGWPS